MKKISLLIFMLILFFSANVNAWISINPSSSINPCKTIEGNLFSNSSLIIPTTLTLIFPKNQTYINNNLIPLNYSYSNADVIKYSIDSTANATITSPTFLGLNDGGHKLYLYAFKNNELKQTKNISFSVVQNKIIIKENKFNNTLRGNTTNFTILSYEELQNLSNLILETATSGKIKFNQNVNLTDDANIEDDEVDLDNYINISSNRIEVNSTALPNLNKSATLFLYGLTFVNPRILKDGVACSSLTCAKESYLDGILTFNVTGFSVYTSEETPVETPSVSPGGSSGGSSNSGGATTTILPIESFSLSLEQLNIKVQQGRVTTQEIIITNNRNTNLTIEVNVSKISNFLVIKEPKFTLKAKESKVLIFEIFALEESAPNLYLGQLNFKAGSEEKTILSAIEVISSNSLFDISAEIPSQFLWVIPGKEMFSKIELSNLGEAGKAVDVDLEYIVMNSKGKEILRTAEEVAVNTKLSLMKSFIIPKETELGKYVLYTKANYNNLVASASVWFNVGTPTQIPFRWAIIVILIFVLSVIVIFIRDNRKIKKDKITKYKVDENALRGAGLIKE